MRITFLTGSLQPGRDGVGDYTALLAHECRRRGIASQVIALADRHVARTSAAVESNLLDDVRLPYMMPWSERFAVVERGLRAFQPDWVSVQFVPYSFQRFGVACRLARTLPRLVRP